MRQIFPLLFLTVLIGCAPAVSSPADEMQTVTSISGWGTDLSASQPSAIDRSPPAALSPSPSRTYAGTPYPPDTNTGVVTPTDFPPLDPHGPYLLVGDFLLNPDGSGVKPIPYPEELWPQKVSPDGEWGVVYRDDICHQDWFCMDFLVESGDTSKKLSLFIYHIPDEKPYFIADMLSEAVMVERYYLNDCSPVFQSMLFRTAWSPDGRYLAFVANTSGRSLDLYTFDTDLHILHRLTDNEDEVVSFAWSPDSRLLYYINGFEMSEYATFQEFSLNATRPDNGPNQGIRTLLISSDELRIVWTGKDHDLMVLHDAHQSCNAGRDNTSNKISHVEYDSGIIHDVFTDRLYMNVAVDPLNRVVLLYALDEDGGGKQGYYIVTFEGQIRSTVSGLSEPPAEMVFLGDSEYEFLLTQRGDGRVLGISLDGSVQRFHPQELEYSDMRVSPDRKWVLLREEKRIGLYTSRGELSHSWVYESRLDFTSGMQDVLWAPDGYGIYFSASYDELYLLTLTDDRPVLIFEYTLSCCLHQLVWVDWQMPAGG